MTPPYVFYNHVYCVICGDTCVKLDIYSNSEYKYQTQHRQKAKYKAIKVLHCDSLEDYRGVYVEETHKWQLTDNKDILHRINHENTISLYTILN